MSGYLQNAWDTWSQYWGEGKWFLVLTALCALYLFVPWEKKNRKFFLGSAAVFLLVYFFPLTGKLLDQFGDGTVYWRILWIFPGGLLAAYSFTALIRKQDSRALRGLLMLVCTGLIFLTGASVYGNGNYEKVHNFQKVPDHVAQICQIIKEDAGEEPPGLTACTDDVAAFVRVYDPSIPMPYGRRAAGAVNGNAVRLYQLIHETDPVQIRPEMIYARRLNVKYLVKRLDRYELVEDYARYKFALIGEVDGYYIFKKTV